MDGRETIAIETADDPRIAEFRALRDRDLTGREGRFIAEGTVVLRMLAGAHAAGAFMAEKILLLKNRVQGVADILALFPPDIPVYVAESDVIDRIAGFHMHRGVLALGRPMGCEGLADRLDALPETALVLVGCGISNHDNVGSMFRNAAAFGADVVLLDETCCDPLYRKALRVSVGSVLSVPFSRQGAASDILASLADRGFAIWSLSPRGSCDIREIPSARRIALVVGTEGEGLPPEILSAFQSARIAQVPGLDSLNVATATGIALYQIAAGMGRI
ncbi:RNA methyltransferase [Rhizobiaceae bacterium n13]|uniref:RNA methyltransferase n=1 Tax=Ferirhizobium litorale TaxID=2927786 RepID=A0AAE3TZA4_9HYPH|nr:RNA methyltransferase [Fererhizobium litorale]MDI7860636.1 RNA methyltransferase [Fererhizobium litorale]MDI7920784.1 RNA methyltransferase [Fererhizobium litorale]